VGGKDWKNFRIEAHRSVSRKQGSVSLWLKAALVPYSLFPASLHAIADDGDFKTGAVEFVCMMELEFRRLYVEVVVPPRNHSGN
jgi:hypothetical protein